MRSPRRPRHMCGARSAPGDMISHRRHHDLQSVRLVWSCIWFGSRRPPVQTHRDTTATTSCRHRSRRPRPWQDGAHATRTLAMGCFWIMMGLAALLFVLYRTTSVVRYYAKFVFFILVSLVCATLPVPLMLLQPRDSRNALMPAWGLRKLSRFMGLRFTVRGKENILKGSGGVVLINHQSSLDLIVLAELWPIMKNCTVISKKEIFYLGPFGLATWLWGTIFIDRMNPEKAQHAINSTGQTIRQREARVLMFPEGTRHGGLDLLPFKKGAFHLAIASECPIQPVVVSNYYFLDDKKYKFDEGNNLITILPAISTKGMDREDLSRLMDETWAVMSKTYKELSSEAQSMNNNRK